MSTHVELSAAIRDLAMATDLQQVMDAVRLNARKLTGADGVTFVLRDGDKCYYAEENAIEPLWKGKRFPMDICISGWVMLNKQQVIIEDVFQDERIPQDAYSPTFVKSLAMVPVRRDDPVAAVGAYWASVHRASSEEMDILFNLADAASIALTNVHLYAELKASSEKYEKLFNQSTIDLELRQKIEDRFRKIYENAAMGIVIEDYKGHILQSNPAFCRLIGYAEQELCNMSSLSIVHSDDRAENIEKINELIAGKIPFFETENRYVRKDGKTAWVSKWVSRLPDNSEDNALLIALVTDISRRKKLETERDTAIAFLRMVNTCRTLEELVQQATLFFQKVSGCEAVGIRLKKGHDYPYFETRGFPSDFVAMENHLCSYDVDGRLRRDANGKPMLECMCGNIICSRFDPSLPFFTKKGSFWSNCTTELLASTTAAERQANTRNRCNGSGYESVALIALRSGEESIGLLQLNDKQKGRFVESTILEWERLAEYLAISLSKFLAEDALRESEERMTLAVSGANLGMWSWDIASGDIWFDRRWAAMLGYGPEEIDNCLDAWKKLVHPDDMPEVMQAIERHINGDTEFYSTQHRLRHKSGEWVWILDSGKVIERDADGKAKRMCGTHQDITQLHSLEERVAQMDKMDAIGQLAGGVAHDFNNQLTGILGFTDLLACELSDKRLQSYAKNIALSANSAADLTRQLLAFSRKGQYKSLLVDMHTIIAEVISILQHTIDKRIEIHRDLNAARPMTVGDPAQFQNMLLNLAINARDAMPEGGTLSFETDVDFLDEEYCQTVSYDIKPGKYLRICVTDSGCGISADAIKHIFEPFFTTKEIGKGTGMGLAAVYGTVKYHLGAINVYSEPGYGTTFRIYLPLDEDSEAEAGAAGKKAPVQIAGARVLVVDDEKLVREMIIAMLEGAGCVVASAENGMEAVAYYEDHWRDIDVVVFDIVMPKMDGKATFSAMKKINPDIRTVLSSGYSINGMAHELIVEGVGEFVQKPFSRAQLVDAVARVLK